MFSPAVVALVEIECGSLFTWTKTIGCGRPSTARGKIERVRIRFGEGLELE